MSESIRNLLKDVVSGAEPPEKLLEGLKAYLEQDGAKPESVRAVINAAEQLGVDPGIISQARALIGDEEKTAFNIGDPTRAVEEGDDRTEIVTPDATRKDIGEPTAMADDERTVITSDEDKTTAVDPDRTVAVSEDDDRTVAVGEDDDRTTALDPDSTIAAGDEDKTAAIAGDDPFSMTDSSKSPKSGGTDHGPGSVLKGRFRLESVIGQGGMGAVYKAVDLLKVEARDRNPYMAVKLLVGDFKEHPEAFIALQRESTKAQRLAHPNIATVYDFDRDGETVYMTMELMEGVELAKYIKKLPAGGLTPEDANKVIEQLCAGLAYAHARGLVHSDFKPGNAFLLDDGTVKLLDFGIARASSTKADAEGETTVFDPGELGALTPAYATIDMFEGKDPDPRDDIYALACVAYELYTGQHPFKKQSAVKARDKKLKPAPVVKLTKRQNRALMRGLALEREDRIGSVDELWDELRPRKDYTWQIAIGSTAVVLLLGALLYNPVLDFIHEREHAAILAEIQSGDEQRMLDGLSQADALPEQRMLAVADRARDTIIGYYQSLAEAEVNHDAGLYDYPAALAHLAELDAYFPDSLAVGSIKQDFESRRQNLLLDTEERYIALRDEGRIMPREDEEDTTDLIAIVREADPDHRMLSDDLLNSAYADLAQEAVEAGDWTRADGILTVALDYAPSNASLLNLNDTVQTELRRQAESQLVAELRATLSDARPGLQTVADFRGVLVELRQLGELRPDDDIINALRAPLRRAFEAEMDRFTGESQWAEADALIADFARLFDIAYLVDARTALTAAQTAAGYEPQAADGRAARLTQHRDAVEALLESPEFDDDWNRTLEGEFKDMIALLTPDAGWFDALRERIARAYIDSATELFEANRFSAAATRLDNGEIFMPGLPGFDQARQALADAQEAYNIAEEERRAAARIEESKGTLLAQARAQRVNDARQTLASLRGQLPADDPFLTEEAPQAIAEAYRAMAEGRAEAGNFGDAATFARAGLEVAPGYQPLLDVVDVYQARERRTQVVNAARSATAQDMAQLGQTLTQVRNALPGEADAINREVVGNLVQRIRGLIGNDLGGARALRQAALQVFPGNPQLQGIDIPADSRFAGQIRTAIGEARLTEARELLQQGRQAEPGHPQLAGFDDDIGAREARADDFYQQAARVQQNDKDRARALLTQAMEIWNDNDTYRQAQKDWFPPPRGTCYDGLARLGGRAAGQCYDTIAGARGPQMVVVPGQGGGAPFAIGKYEVSVEEYNRYCTTTGNCQPSGEDAQRPVTGISIQNAENYIAWLSRESGQAYRLPTAAEWTHAAGGGGDPGSAADNNCRVVRSGMVIKGASLLNINTGSDNAWGVRNHVGNAQEWVRDGSTLAARGGSIEDSLSDCSVAMSHPHSGAADAVTGFRVFRELD